MVSIDAIREALGVLDPSDDAHWTTTGLPRMDVLESVLGDSLTRSQVTEADPSFSRENANTQQAPEQSGAPGECEAHKECFEQQLKSMIDEVEENKKRILELQTRNEYVSSAMDDVRKQRDEAFPPPDAVSEYKRMIEASKARLKG